MYFSYIFPFHIAKISALLLPVILLNSPFPSLYFLCYLHRNLILYAHISLFISTFLIWAHHTKFPGKKWIFKCPFAWKVNGNLPSRQMEGKFPFTTGYDTMKFWTIVWQSKNCKLQLHKVSKQLQRSFILLLHSIGNGSLFTQSQTIHHIM